MANRYAIPVTIGNINGDLLPSADDTYDIGSTTAAWQDLFLEGDITLSDATTIFITAAAHDTVGPALTISAGDTTAGTTNNIAGGAVTIQGGQGKGSGAGGDIIFQTANAGSSGSAINALATALTISDDLSSTFAGAVTIDGDLVFTGPQQISTSSGALTLKATTNTNLLRAGDGTIVSMTRNAVANWDWYIGNSALGTGVAGSGSLELQPGVGAVEFAILAAGVSPLPKFIVNTSTGNTQIGGSADHGTTVGTNVFSIFDGAAPVGTLLNGISLYSTSGECRVMDAAGNATLLSPHDSEGAWVFDSKDVEGKRLVIHMEKFMRALEAHFGWGFIEEFIEEV